LEGKGKEVKTENSKNLKGKEEYKNNVEIEIFLS